MNSERRIKFFHVEVHNYSDIVSMLEEHLKQKQIKELIAIYSGAGGLSVLSADLQIHILLIRLGGKELLQDSLIYYALSKGPEFFSFHYGNKELVNDL